MTERIDHVAEAINYLDATPIETHAEADRKVVTAQVHATLALVEQQRIANLLTIANWVSNSDLGVKLDDLRIGVAGEVWEGLGLS